MAELKLVNDLPEGELIGYARVSTVEQSLRLQIDALLKYGVSKANIFEEKMSGASAHRPQLTKALKILRPGWKLVFWKLDRVARDVGHLIRISEEVKDKKCDLVSLTEQIDTSTAIGSLYFHMLGAFAQFERDLTKERTSAGMQALKATGKKFGRARIVDDKKRQRIRADLDARNEDGRLMYSIREIAELHEISVGTVNNEFPRYRTSKARETLRGMRPPKGPKRTWT
jgi:DNA invertase Pin-like site-specific DNA recombinase